MVVIVEKPRINIAFAQRRLNGSQVHGEASIVNKSKTLGESEPAKLGLWGSRRSSEARLFCAVFQSLFVKVRSVKLRFC